MPYALEIPHNTSLHNKAIVVNTLTGHHASKDPIPIKKAEAQLRILRAAERKEGPTLLHSAKDPPKKWIQSVVESPKFRKGAFTKKAKEHGETPKEYMTEVLAHPEKHDIRTRKQAQFMKNIQRK